MSQEKISEAAKAGHPQAIAAMINKSLESKSITVKPLSSNGCLTLIAESQTVPSQDFLLNYLEQGLNKLKPANISRVIVRGRITGQTTNVWQASFMLDSSESEEAKNQPQAAVAANPVATSRKSIEQAKNSISGSSSKNQKLTALLNFTKSRNGERAMLAAGSFLVTSILWLGIGSLVAQNSRSTAASNHSTSTAVASAQPSAEKNTEEVKSSDAANNGSEVENFVRAYLEKIVGGEDGSGFFCEQNGVSTFFSPRNFQILKAEMYDTVGQAIVRLDSSNKGGSQITKNWKLLLKKGQPQYAALIGEAGKYGICINLVTGND